METLLLAALNWIHLIATVVWIGGIAFLLFIALPSAKELLGTDAGKIMGIIARRFTPLANYSIVLLIATGIAITVLNRNFSGAGAVGTDLAVIFILKIAVVSAMVTIHFYRGLVLAPRIKMAGSSARQSSMQKLSLNLVKVNFVLGLGILLLSAGIAIV